MCKHEFRYNTFIYQDMKCNSLKYKYKYRLNLKHFLAKSNHITKHLVYMVRLMSHHCIFVDLIWHYN